MKTRNSLGWVLGIVLAGGAVVSGFAQDSLNPAQTAVSPEKTGAAATASVEPGTPFKTAPQPATAAPAAPGNAGGDSLSSNRYLSPWFYEIERLTQAGVAEAAVLSYINDQFERGPGHLLEEPGRLPPGHQRDDAA